MDYEVGSVSDFISGNITPNRPKCVKALTAPTKQQQSPNITPKSAGLVDRSQGLSPSVQRKKAVVKKSPKRIFQADVVEQKAKQQLVKKLLEDELESNTGPKKLKKKCKSCDKNNREIDDQNETPVKVLHKEPKKIKREEHTTTPEIKNSGSNAIKCMGLSLQKKIQQKNRNGSLTENKNSEPTKNNKDKQSDSKTLSDDAIYSENESEKQFEKDTNNYESSTEDEKEVKEKQFSAKQKNIVNNAPVAKNTKKAMQRTLYVRNVPFTKNTKKVLKSIFNKYGKIISIRIRNFPTKDTKSKSKLAINKNAIHSENPVVSCYVKFAYASSIKKALEQNNALIGKHKIRVDRSDSIDLPDDPQKTVVVGNIPEDMQDETLRSIFEKCGDIKSVRILRDHVTQIGKGIGFINFAAVDGVELAFKLEEKDITIKDRVLRLKRYNQTPKPQEKFVETLNSLIKKEGVFKSIKNKQAKENNKQSNKDVIEKQKKEFAGTSARKIQKKNTPNKNLKKQKKIIQILTGGRK